MNNKNIGRVGKKPFIVSARNMRLINDYPFKLKFRGTADEAAKVFEKWKSKGVETRLVGAIAVYTEAGRIPR